MWNWPINTLKRSRSNKIFCVVFITAPVGRIARKIANKIVKDRLAACVNIVSQVDSLYWWKGKMESAEESLLIIKTRKRLVGGLIKLMKKVHPYTVPEIISFPITAGNKPYLRWLSQEMK